MRTIIVTGASGNMGRAIVARFLDGGYRVIATLSPNDVHLLDIKHDHFEQVRLDLLDESRVAEFVKQVVTDHHQIDAAVMTAGGFAIGNISSTTAEDISKQIKLNFNTTYNIVRPIFGQMMKQMNGRIFMTGSRPGLHHSFGGGMIAYGLGKSMLFRLADLMNDEAKGKDVVTSIVVPSTIDTPQNRLAMPDADPGNWVRPEEIANIIYYHCSDEAKTLRETVIKVYGNS